MMFEVLELESNLDLTTKFCLVHKILMLCKEPSKSSELQGAKNFTLQALVLSYSSHALNILYEVFLCLNYCAGNCSHQHQCNLIMPLCSLKSFFQALNYLLKFSLLHHIIYTLFKKIFLEDISILCGATNTPVFDFW